MSLFPVRHDDLHGAADAARSTFARALARVAAAFTTMHRAIIAAKLRRMRRELIYHDGNLYGQPSDSDAAQLPQPPLVLGDKWEF